MRDYIILNGVNSNTIAGLLIQALPPISKPSLRTQTETIDGRDGDKATALGYAAYDKTVSIGLYGSFDINAIISFFDGSGTVVFSSEPDKFYYYRIEKQIDFAKLIRFRTANVVLHVQPFKYSTTETPQTPTISGGSCTITNSGNYMAKPKITINGSGNITVALNSNQVFVIALADEGYITIDTAQMEAYKDGVLKNRLVIGDYSNFALHPGSNTITFSGDVTSVSIENYSRWL